MRTSTTSRLDSPQNRRDKKTEAEHQKSPGVRYARNSGLELDCKPPQNLQSEKALLGSLIIRPTEFDNVQGILRENDFYDPSHRELFRSLAMLYDADEPIDDARFLIPRLKELGIAHDNLVVYISEFCVSAGAPANAKHHAKRIADLAKRRRQLDLAASIIAKANDDQIEADKTTSMIEVEIESWNRREQQPAHRIHQIAEDVWQAIKQPKKNGIGTGFLSIDESVGLMFPGEVHVLAARPGVGKTAFAQFAASHAARQNKTVLFVSLEMPAEELTIRWLCGESGVDGRIFRRNEQFNSTERNRLCDQIAQWKNENLTIDIWSPYNATIGEIRSKARIARVSRDMRLLVIDYLQLIEPTDVSVMRHEQIGQMTRQLKNLSKELEVPILLLAQLNRDAEGQRPSKRHLRESGAIEQDADRIILLHHKDNAPNTIEAIIDKNRHGELAICDLQFEHGRFVNETPGRIASFDAFNESA